MRRAASRLILFSWQRQTPTWNVRGVTVFLPVVVLSFCLNFTTAAQPQRCWITLRDRGPSVTLTKANPASLGITERALWRRSKVLPADRLIDELDLPPEQSYLEQLRSRGVVVRSASRWLNAVSAELTDAQRSSVATLPFVASVSPVPVFFKQQQESVPLLQGPMLKKESIAGIDYGESFAQLNALKVPDVHSRGFTGTGVIIGVLDDGFNAHRTHPALKNLKIIAEYDFVQRDSNTSRSPGEYSTQGNHGASTLSEIGGFFNGRLVGVAYGASFMLAKTEIDSVEIQLEEDLYVEALEWMERRGVDITSSSLGYSDWYKWSDMNGKTATTSRAASIAARKGVLVVTAMGNSGGATIRRTDGQLALDAPADADSILAVGATFADGPLASFSLTGPTYDGRTKPEVVAPGINDFAVSGDSDYTPYFTGTSAATPLAAGVAALVLSANLDLTPMQVRARLLSTTQKYADGSAKTQSYPNNYYGWGLLDASKAVGGSGGGSVPAEFVLRNNYPNPFNGSTTIIVDAPGEQVIDVAVYDLLGRRVRTLYKGKSRTGTNFFEWNDGLNDSGTRVSSGVYICRLATYGFTGSRKILYIK
ncbi:MAG: S8 family serine peptidase [Ignavibacteriales bacterium]|nr:S8 family serine peptidase [Ignavibacteriales bacterium]